jgi:tetratricopeptide (TPR) repeat protein
MTVAPTTDPLIDSDEINFGELPEEVNALLQRGVAAYRRDWSYADRLFRQALAAAPRQLPIYYCLYKVHTYQGHLNEALAAAQMALREAARQAGWSADWHDWTPPDKPPDGPARFALYTLKAMAFIHLRRDERDKAARILDCLARLDPRGAVGWPVVAALAQALT